MDQSFSEKSFWKTLRKGDAQKYNLGKNRGEIKDSLKTIEDAVSGEGFKFQTFSTQIRNKFKVFTTNNKVDEFVLRKVADNLKRALGIKSADRNELVPQVINLAKEARDCTIYKFDIGSFFESIDRGVLLKNLNVEEKLSLKTVQLISSLFQSEQIKMITGLPRGLSISPILAEYYLRNLESACRRFDYCYYYTRYVDDMLFFCHGNSNSLNADLVKNLPAGLTLNSKKAAVVSIDRKGLLLDERSSEKSISYLGYEIIFPSIDLEKMKISIPQSKIAKIKSRIAMSVVRFIEDKSYEKLLLRIRFLTCNFQIGGSKQIGILYSGVYYNHRYIDSESAQLIFSDLDDYLQKLIYSKTGSLGRKLHPLLSNSRRKELCSHSFLMGHKKPIYRKLKNKELGEATEAWAHA
ncbi:antiviral reverse transcriptase Drt3a [Variovorax sp. R-27]|uniref:antiviral reverse transcriptase Drt3a n=1 Tax=Variovorax sp. R-27 TaxID=3404058 RepID=UPI003CF447B0